MPDADFPPPRGRPAWSPERLALLPALLLLLLAAWAVWRGQAAIAGLLLLAGGLLIGIVMGRRQLAQALQAMAADLLADAGRLPTPSAQRTASTAAQRDDPAQGGGGSAWAHAPELAPLSDGLQRVLAQQQALFEAQAQQLEVLRLQAHSDALTGLPNRRHFVAMLNSLLGSQGAPPEAGLLLLRLQDLPGLNRRLGHGPADQMLQQIAQALHAYPKRIQRCCVGRLNGADFALLLPVAGVAAETAQALLKVLNPPMRRIDPQVRLVAGVVDLRTPIAASDALALADAALAQAEIEAEAGPDSDGAAPRQDLAAAAADLPPAAGEPASQRHIARALVQGRVALGEYPVRTADGRQLHLDCPLRVQLSADGPFEPASRWLALATRSRLCAVVDELALTLALAAIERDGQARCINMAAQSLASAGFKSAVSRRLDASPNAACRLWIDLPEALALAQPKLVREVSRRWRPRGVMLALEHAGEALTRIPRLTDMGLDCVRIDARFVNGIAGQPADAQRYLQGLVQLVQSVGLQVAAEGVMSAADLDCLWAMGFDMATGPALAEAGDKPAPDQPMSAQSS